MCWGSRLEYGELAMVAAIAFWGSDRGMVEWQRRGGFAGAPIIFGLGIAPWWALCMAWAFSVIYLFP